MDAPRIQYAKTSDGVSIAYWAIGEGKPLVLIAPLPFTHVQLEWEIPEIRSWYERLAQRRTVIRYDGRGLGLSDRDADNFALDALVLDLEAVVGNLDQFAVMGAVNSGPVAIEYSVRHPEMVSHLLLWCTYARGSEFFQATSGMVLRNLVDQDWRMFTETVAHSREGWSQGSAASAFAHLIRECVTPEVQGQFMDTMSAVDVTSELGLVKAPTLVMHRKNHRQIHQSSAMRLAAGIPNARLALLEGEGAGPYLGNTDAVIGEMFSFLGEPALDEIRVPPAPAAPPAVPGALASAQEPHQTAIILFADIVDSTALTERFGDAAFRAKARELDSALRTLIRDNSGTAIEGKLLGDGVLAVFTSARRAIEGASACARAGDEGGLPLHLGLHAGDVIREDNNVYGGAVNIASRISGLSAPGEVLVSETVRSLARTSAGVEFEDRGEQALKGVGEAVRVWAVRV